LTFLVLLDRKIPILVGKKTRIFRLERSYDLTHKKVIPPNAVEGYSWGRVYFDVDNR
jgi:hypothetical protein